MQQAGLVPIDLVVVNLYPFRQAVARGAPFDEVIENIDIGGPALIRAAAKKHQRGGGGGGPPHQRRGVGGERGRGGGSAGPPLALAGQAVGPPAPARRA